MEGRGWAPDNAACPPWCQPPACTKAARRCGGASQASAEQTPPAAALRPVLKGSAGQVQRLRPRVLRSLQACSTGAGSHCHGSFLCGGSTGACCPGPLQQHPTGRGRGACQGGCWPGSPNSSPLAPGGPRSWLMPWDSPSQPGAWAPGPSPGARCQAPAAPVTAWLVSAGRATAGGRSGCCGAALPSKICGRGCRGAAAATGDQLNAASGQGVRDQGLLPCTRQPGQRFERFGFQSRRPRAQHQPSTLAPKLCRQRQEAVACPARRRLL